MADGGQVNGWHEWSRHVLKELERLNESYSRLRTDVSDVKAKVNDYSPQVLTRLQVGIEGLVKSVHDQETRIRSLEQESAASQVNATLANVSQEKLAKLADTVREMETREATFSGKWAILSIAGSAVIGLLIGWAFKAVTPDPSKVSKPPVNPPAEIRRSAGP